MDRTLGLGLAVGVACVGGLLLALDGHPLPPPVPPVVAPAPPVPPVPVRSPVELIPDDTSYELRNAAREPYRRAAEFGAESLGAPWDGLRALAQPKLSPEFGDWLFFQEGSHQTFAEYAKGRRSKAEGKRRVIELRLLGPFTPAQRRVLADTADWLARWYQLPVRFGEELPLESVPAYAWRTSGDGHRQIRTPVVLRDVLGQRLPDDAMALMGFTAVDLFPNDQWNFVFGQSSFDERVAVFSMCRLGDPDASEAQRARTLLRTLKIATHELAHSFSIPHCAAWQCVVNGSNGLSETDEAPLWECPVCAKKLHANRRWDPAKRARELAAFASAHGLEAERAHYEATAVVLAKARR